MRNIIYSVFVLDLVLFGFSEFLIGQTASQPKAGIIDITPTLIVSLEIEVRAANKPLVIPNCRLKDEDRQVPCAAYVQRFNGKKWYFAKPRYGAVLGQLVKEFWKPVVIAPGKETTFQYGIDTDFFGIQKGERMRIVIDAWDSAESMMKNDNPDSKFVSPTFVCP